MSEDVDFGALGDSLKKAKDEFEIAAAIVANALKEVHERLERIERWITKSQKSPQE